MAELDFEKHAVSQLNEHQGCCMIFGVGISPTQIIIQFLNDLYHKNADSSDAPFSNHLVFLMGCSDYQLDDISKNVDVVKDVRLNPTNKRIEAYLSGGIFAPTAATLILDLLSKKLSPHVISGRL